MSIPAHAAGSAPPIRRPLEAGADSADSLTSEQTLALARVFLAFVSLGAGYLDASEPDIQRTQLVLTVYGAYSLLVLGGLWVWRPSTPRLPVVLHGLDVLFASGLMVLTDAPCSYFLPPSD